MITGLFLFGCGEQNNLSELERFNSVPDIVINELRAKDELERIDTVLALMERYPNRSSQLCPLLSGDAQLRCISISERPHLWSEKKEVGKSSVRTVVAQTNCQQGPKFRLCLEDDVKQSIRKGQIERVKGLCANIKDEKWFSECIFAAAEQATKHRGAHGYAEGVELCIDAGSFSANCQNHLIMILAQKAPMANQKSVQDWAPIQSASSAVRAAW